MSPLLIVILANFAISVLRVIYVLLYPIDLSPEEAQYWDWSRHPDLSYYSKPPMVAYLNLLSTTFLGNTELAVRITPIILSFALSVITFLFVRHLFGEKEALFAALLPNLLVGYAINSLLMTTDAPFLFFWSLSVMLIYVASEKNSLSLWFAVGVSAGLAFLSKYPALFLLPLTLLYFFLVRRDLLLSPRPYLSLLPAFFLSLPVLVWNLKRDFVSFKHVSALAGGGSFPNLPALGEFIGGQVLLLSAIPFLFMLYGWWRSIKSGDERLLFLTVFSLPIVLFFSLLSLKKEVYANWAGFAYFTGSILASLYMSKVRVRVLVPSLALPLFLTITLHFTPLLDFLGLRELLPPRRDPVKVMVGWEKLGREVSALYTGRELIFSNAYQIAAELAFYVEGNPRTFVFHTGRMTQYYLWKDGLGEFKGKDALYISEGGLPKRVKERFESYELVGSVDILWRGERVRKFSIFKLKGFEGRFGDDPESF